MTIDEEITAAEVKLAELRRQKEREEETPGCVAYQAYFGPVIDWGGESSSVRAAWGRAAQAVLERFGSKTCDCYDPSRPVAFGDVGENKALGRYIVVSVTSRMGMWDIVKDGGYACLVDSVIRRERVR